MDMMTVMMKSQLEKTWQGIENEKRNIQTILV
jgi:hypothetical protein